MRIERIEVFPTRLPVSAELRISRGTVTTREEGAPHVFVRVSTDTGLVGWGEARPSRRWSYETLETVVTTIRRYLAPALVGLEVEDEQAVRRAMEREIAPSVHTGQPIAKSAVEMALCDLLSRAAGKGLADYLRDWLSAASGREETSPVPPAVPLSYLITTDDPEEVARQVREGLEAGFQAFKIKIGIDPERDAAILDAASESAEGAFLWADANQAYGFERALEVGRAAERMGIDVLEQPLPAAAIAAQIELCKALDVPVVLDESVFDLLQLEELLRLKAMDGVVVKVGKMGGVRTALACAVRAREAGLMVLMSGLTESRLGLAASAAVAAAAGLDRPADLNGQQFLAADCLPGEPLTPTPLWKLPREAGIGLVPEQDRLSRFSADHQV